MPADEPNDAEALLQWAERVVADEDDRVDAERVDQLTDDLISSIVATNLLLLETEQGGEEVARLTPAELRAVQDRLREANATAERLLDEITGGDPR